MVEIEQLRQGIESTERRLAKKISNEITPRERMAEKAS
jgi:hypothetical protein